MWVLHGLVAEVWALAIVLALKPRVCDMAHLGVGRMGRSGPRAELESLEGGMPWGSRGGPVLGWRLEPGHRLDPAAHLLFCRLGHGEGTCAFSTGAPDVTPVHY